MHKLVLIGTAFALLFPSIGSGVVFRQADVRTKLCAKPKVLKTRSIPATATPQMVRAWVNGYELRGWQEGSHIASFAGYGVIVQISTMKKTGPATLRLASALRYCAKVRVLLVWR